MKKISRLLCSLFIAVILAFNTAIIPAMNVHASEYAALGLYELLQALLMSAGSSVCGLTNYNDFQLSDAAYDSLVTVVFQNNPTLAKYLSKANELDMDASFRAQLEAAAEGEEFAYDDLKITKSKTGYKLQASKGLVSEAAKAIKEWADSDENMFLTSSIEALEESAYSTVNYVSAVNVCTNSISDISKYYSSVVTDKLAEIGADDSNCMVVCTSASVSKSYFSGWDGIVETNDLLHDGTAYIFYVIPFGYSYLSQGAYQLHDNNSNCRTRGQIYKTDILVNLPFKIASVGTYYVEEYLQAQRADSIKTIFYYPSYDDCEVRTFNFSAFPETSSFCFYFCKGVFNYQKAVDNGCMVVDSITKNTSISVQKNEVTSYHITSGTGSKYANKDDYVSMDFDSTTAGTLASYSSLADYVKYAMSLSAQLSDIKDAIEDSTEQNAAQAKEIVSAINTQTDVISAGLSDVITSVKVQTDAISDVLEATKLQTDAIGDVIIGLDDVCSAIKDLSITLPSDLTLTIPEEKLNINVTVPDISTEVINNIEVKHDYPALQKAIEGAIAAPLQAAFVPDEDKVRIFFDDFNHKFSFVDDMKTNIENVKKYVFGVTPSPILKIPIMKTESKYDYGFGDYFIIDVSWYAKYRPYGDLVILAFAWLMFIWRVFISLPGIISGSPGSMWHDSSVLDTRPGIGMNDPTMIEDKRRKF